VLPDETMEEVERRASAGHANRDLLNGMNEAEPDDAKLNSLT
jgi:hypothetical protein